MFRSPIKFKMNGTVRWQFLILLLAWTRVNAAFQLKKNEYHSYDEMTNYLKSMNLTSNITNLYSIGKSIEGRELWVMEIAGLINDDILRPNVKLVANVHGTESAGREVSLQFIQYLVDQYNSRNVNVTELLDYASVHVLPSINPDGFEKSLYHYNMSKYISDFYHDDEGWKNNATEDLDLNFPIDRHSLDIKKVPESVAVMRWMETKKFILSLSLQGSARAAIYPYDQKTGVSKTTTENNVFKHLAELYSKCNTALKKGCGSFPNGKLFRDGINGTDWNSINGTMQHYNYIAHRCLELTVKISCEAFTDESRLSSIWEDNKQAILTFMKEVQKGVRGFVKDENEAAVPNANITIHHTSFKATPKGEYWGVLAGNYTDYTVKVEADGFQLLETTIHLEKKSSARPEIKNLSLRIPPADSSTCHTTSTTTTVNPQTSSDTSHISSGI